MREDFNKYALEMYSLIDNTRIRLLRPSRMITNDYHPRVAKTVIDVCERVEAVFEYVTDVDDVKVFRKRK